MPKIPDALLDRLYASARAEQWDVPRAAFRAALERSVAHGLGEAISDAVAVRRYCEALRLDDLALACACAAGHDAAWEHFVLTFRPQLYRAADSIAPDGRARDLADALYGELFGVREGDDGQRRSHFVYFHGRSSLATWLRAVLAQRHIDRIRTDRRVDTIPDDDSPQALSAPSTADTPERHRFLRLMQAALAFALALLTSHDRLRLGCYYAQQMTLAQIGRLLGEHEATVSRQLARTRHTLRTHIESYLHERGHLDEAGVSACFEAVAQDAGPLDLTSLLASANGDPTGPASRKNAAADRSSEGHQL